MNCLSSGLINLGPSTWANGDVQPGWKSENMKTVGKSKYGQKIITNNLIPSVTNKARKCNFSDFGQSSALAFLQRHSFGWLHDPRPPMKHPLVAWPFSSALWSIKTYYRERKFQLLYILLNVIGKEFHKSSVDATKPEMFSFVVSIAVSRSCFCCLKFLSLRA